MVWDLPAHSLELLKVEMEDLLLAGVWFSNTVIFLCSYAGILLIAMHSRINLVFFK